MNYDAIEQLKGVYGFKDAYNLSKGWFARDVIGIDKGVTLLMLANHANELVYRNSMVNENILNGLARLGITKTESQATLVTVREEAQLAPDSSMH
jgi:hypothetical protein